MNTTSCVRRARPAVREWNLCGSDCIRDLANSCIRVLSAPAADCEGYARDRLSITSHAPKSRNAVIVSEGEISLPLICALSKPLAVLGSLQHKSDMQRHAVDLGR